MKKICFILTIWHSYMYCQINPNTLLPNVMPASPQAFQFMKYGEIPVKQYTGMPDVTIPIYTLKTKGLDIPIALRYHANGIKVNEEASWVGLGWNLSAEFEIVQTVQGLDDFGKFRHRALPNFNCMIPLQASGLSGQGVISQFSPFIVGYNDNWNQSYPSCYVDGRYASNQWDNEPDYFYFNAAGYSGKFVLNFATEQFVCITDKNIKIDSDLSPNANGDEIAPSVYFITMPDGNRFEFRLQESTVLNFSRTVHGNYGDMPAAVDTRGEKTSRVYKLTKLMTSQADVVDFEYENSETIIGGANVPAVSKNFPYINLSFRTEVPSSAINVVVDQQPLTLAPVTNVQEPRYATSYNATQQTYSFLKKIKYNDETIEFISSLRQDLKEAKKLDKILVKYLSTSTTFLFDYDYFVGNNFGNNYDSFLNYGTIEPYNCEKTQDETIKRLKLTSFRQINEKPYTFEYNSQSLPKKTSYSVDYWGFYNGKDDNISFFPNIYNFNLERNNIQYYDF